MNKCLISKCLTELELKSLKVKQYPTLLPKHDLSYNFNLITTITKTTQKYTHKNY